MKILALAIVLLSPLAVIAATCTGADPCKACRDCSACWHCSPKNPHRGSCGCLRDQNAEQRKKSDAKRAKGGK